MRLPRTSLVDTQEALSHLSFAATEELKGLAPWGVKIGYNSYPGLGLFLEIECKARNSQHVADRLTHGIIWGPYDYRFNVGREMNTDPEAWVKVTAYPKLHEHREPLHAPAPAVAA